MFKYTADKIPVTIILALSLIDFLLYFLVENIWVLLVYWMVMIIPKMNICAWSHHHQHLPTYKQKSLNRVLEFFYALHTGATTNTWVLHHVLGHHKNYLDQTIDESRWQRRNGKQMGEIEYSFVVALTAYTRAFKVGLKHPTPFKRFLIFSGITFVIVAALVFFKPVAGLFLFLLPMVCGLLLTAWATYEHHSGLDTDDTFEGSRNNLNRYFNLVTGNLGYHTAHHYQQGVHWSLLPDLHEKIKDRIPEHLVKYTVL